MSEMIKNILDALNATGIQFALEAWTERPSGDAYGVLSVGVGSSLYGDDGFSERSYAGIVNLFVNGNGFVEAEKVDRVLSEITDSYQLRDLKFVNEVAAMRWQWIFEVI